LKKLFWKNVIFYLSTAFRMEYSSMLEGEKRYGNTFAEAQMVQTSPSKNWYATHAQGYAFFVPSIQAHAITNITTPLSCFGNHVSRTHLPEMNHHMTSSVGTGTQLTTVNHPPAGCNHLCNFLAQLQGNFWNDGLDGGKLQIVLGGIGDKQHAIARGVCSAGEDLLIYDENSRFTLCSVNDDVEAVMLKGVSSVQRLTWWKNDGEPMVWRRLINKHEAMQELTLSRISREFSEQELSDDGACKCPEVPVPDEHLTNDLTNCSVSIETSAANCAINQKLSDNELFGIFRTHCEDPQILQEVLDWGITRTPNLKVGEKEIRELAAGRFWVNVRLSSSSSKYARKFPGVLDDLKGAYQELRDGVYYQPAPKPNEPGVQHRLRSLNGYWVIEVFDVERGIWIARSQELPNGKWVDLTSGLKLYNIHVVPMVDILNRMKNDWLEYDEMEKRIEFLFNTCNQKKLNTKLKPRSLKHHIVNLRVKLEKQYSLSFAVRVARTADSIALNRRRARPVESIEVH